ncbi:MAG: CDP-alcohol phosphatidyltransferase family protein [Arachnia sp.]
MQTARGIGLAGLAAALLWCALTLPSALDQVVPAAFLRMPLEAVVLLTLLVALPVGATRSRTALAVIAGVALAAFSVLRLLDIGFMAALGRFFNPVVDWGNVVSGATLLLDAVGRPAGLGLLALAGLIVLALFVAMPLAVARIGGAAAKHRRTARRVTVALAVIWLVLALGQVDVGGAPLASSDASQYAYRQVTAIPQGLRDKREFADAAARDPLHTTPSDELLAGLRGKDVLFVFIESYGRVALEDPELSGGVRELLASENDRLHSAGFSSRSAFLTSPTVGGISWLAHSTLQSGLWVDSKQRYDVLLDSDRLTLSHAFGRAGWRTVVDVPANTADWSRRSFYHWDQLYDSRNVGYAGPRFGYPTIPDQYTLEALHRLELAADDRQPVMAEVDLVSSHAPWAPLPRLVPQGEIGDGSVYSAMPQSAAPSGVAATRAAYVSSIEYSLASVFSFMEAHGDEDTVLVVMGDHQPAAVVTGTDRGRDVPITVIAKDPAVFEQIGGWGWDDGVLPSPDAPVWRMDTVRDRFLAAFHA